jgi:hypothetical protein
MKEIYRQRKWQLKQIAQGLCCLCNRKRITKNHCRKHRDQVRQDGLKRYRRLLGMPLDTPRLKRGRKKLLAKS